MKPFSSSFLFARIFALGTLLAFGAQALAQTDPCPPGMMRRPRTRSMSMK
jgi:hypothetical protein